MKTLDNQKLGNLLSYIKEYQQQNGKSPSYRTIMKDLKFNDLAMVFRYVNRLYSNGLLKKDNLGAIQIPSQYKTGQTILAPVVGSVACGQPTLAIQNIEFTARLPVEIFGNQELYGLYAQGDSMVGVGIFDGDLIFYLPTNIANDGDIVVALIGDEAATVKRYFKRKEGVVLHPENPSYQDIITKDVKIQGIVKRVVRCF
ncbi:MAG TPA: repressor LexA [Candidatus Caccovivens faecavium]|nr:repressor LexA [Candidatus Caccovivens faecavium]